MHRLLALLSVAVLALAACAPQGGAATDPAPGSPAGPGPATADWRTIPLTDAATGETFRIADLAGKVVAIEPMAIWCESCRSQQHAVAEMLDRLATDDLVYLSLDVDSGEQATDLAAYADAEGFDWRFAVAPREVARGLADEFGSQILSPPATPLIVLDPSGAVVDQRLGRHQPDELAAILEPHLPG